MERFPLPVPRLPTAVFAAMLATVMMMAPAATAQAGADVRLEDQTSGGTTVHVAEATLPDGGFITIHDASLTDGDVLGSVVGSSGFLSGGAHEDISVHLSEPLSEDATLIAMPHKDTDGDHTYSFVSENAEVDGPYTDGGDPVVDDAEITASATVNATDQPTDGDSVIVDRVEMTEGGFLAIHDDTLLEGDAVGSVVGHSSFLAAGTHEDVRVDLTETIAENETIIPMPHRDSDGDESYDFVTSEGEDDPPYVDREGEAVIDQADITPSGSAHATFEAQPSGGHTVHVAEAFLPEGGFVTMHDSSLLDGQTFESVRGTSACLDPGIHRDLVVHLDEPLSEDDTLIAMPHKDTDGDCNYDFVTSEGSDDGPYTSEGGAVTDSGEVTVSASVTYTPQDSDGRTIEIEHADLSEGGFIAVHDNSLLAGEVTGSVVGHSQYLEAGSYEDLEIDLGAPIKTSQTLIPMPHKDTDGDEAYTFPDSEGSEDGPFVTGEGDPVVDTGLTVVRSQVTLEEQAADGTVTVASVTMHDGGFLTLHDGSLLDGEVLGSVVGVSQKLDPGTQTDVEISLDDPPEGEATLIAMPHRDTNDNDAYDFVDSEGQHDGPYVTDEGAVVHPASVTFPTADGGDDQPTSDDTDQEGAAEGPIGGDTEDEVPAPGVGLLLAVVAGLAGLLSIRKRT